MRNSNDNSNFKKFIWIYFAVLLTLTLVCLLALWVSLNNYQEKLDAQAAESEGFEDIGIRDQVLGNNPDEEKYAQAAFLSYVETLDENEWVNIYYSNHPERYDRQEDVISFIEENIINADLESYKAGDYNVSAPEYLQMAGEDVIARFYLAGSGNSYSVSTVELDISGDKTLELTAPASAAVSINSSLMQADGSEEDMVTIEASSVKVDDYQDSLVNPVILNTYTVNGLLSDYNEVNVDGAMLSADGSYYEVIDDSQYQDKALAFIKALLNYYVSGKENMEGNLASVLGHVGRNSKAYKVLSESTSGMAFRTRDNAVYSTDVSPVYKAADNCLFVDVTYTNEKEASIYGNDGGIYRVFMLDEGDGYRIVTFSGL